MGDVVKLITSIAEQTSPLALNATTIEAARAGRCRPRLRCGWWPRRSRRWPARLRKRPTRSRTRSRACAARDRGIGRRRIKAISQTIERISGIAGSISAAGRAAKERDPPTSWPAFVPRYRGTARCCTSTSVTPPRAGASESPARPRAGCSSPHRRCRARACS
ncbi:hypothetical protein ACU4GH_35605 [Bradyrhizobium betae]